MTVALKVTVRYFSIRLHYGSSPSKVVASACTAVAEGAAPPITTSLKPKKMAPFSTPMALPSTGHPSGTGVQLRHGRTIRKSRQLGDVETAASQLLCTCSKHRQEVCLSRYGRGHVWRLGNFDHEYIGCLGTIGANSPAACCG